MSQGDKVRRCATIMDGDRHEFLQADGSWGRCGGPRYCRECNRAADIFQCDECPMADPGECLKASHCPHRDGPRPTVEETRTAELTKPWADYHGDLPDYDHPLRCVFESGVQYAVELLAKELKVTDWAVCDGTEEYDGDLGGTLMNIVLAAMPKDEHGDPVCPRDLPASLPRQAGREAIRQVVFRHTGCSESCADAAADAIVELREVVGLVADREAIAREDKALIKDLALWQSEMERSAKELIATGEPSLSAAGSGTLKVARVLSRAANRILALSPTPSAGRDANECICPKCGLRHGGGGPIDAGF